MTDRRPAQTRPRSVTGFTLIELLIVIALLAVLSAALVLALDPAERLRQSRDADRLSDLGILANAIALYVTDTGAASWTATSTCTAGTAMPGGGSCRTATSTAVNGSGWVPLNFTAIAAGAPFSKLPTDPLNTAASSSQGCSGAVPGCFYAYKASTTPAKYKLYASMESVKYSVKENQDGGNVPDWYETGTELQGL